FLQDITACRKMAFLTRSFLHDISNTVAGLTGLTQLYENSDRPLDPARNRDLFGRISNLSLRLAREIEVHRYLIGREQSMYKSEWEPVSVLEILKEIGDTFARHPATRDKHLVFPEPCEMLNLIFATDRFLLLRILSNMVVNALEASEPGDTVRISVSRSLDRLTFSVWNRAFIMPKFARRVFERDFTTKPEAGRGMGTYTMKRFGEESLGGTVDFMTSPVEGTTFSFTIPI
ncbi:MAG: sensor histidine kinase, partial [Thermodesulfobacteriota bacterium]